VQHYRTLAEDAKIEPQDFTLMLPRAVAIALAAGEVELVPAFGPARVPGFCAGG